MAESHREQKVVLALSRSLVTGCVKRAYTWLTIAMLAQPLVFSPHAMGAPVKVILDTDLASDCDDLGVVAVLHALASQGRVQILGMVCNVSDPNSPNCLRAINTYYGRPDIPVGYLDAVYLAPGVVPGAYEASAYNNYTAYIADPTHYPRKDDAVTNALSVYVSLLQSNTDVTIVAVGSLYNLAELLRTRSDLVTSSVAKLIVMGGSYPPDSQSIPDYNFSLDVAGAQAVVAGWPTPIVFTGIGGNVITGAGLTNGNVAADNPIRCGYALGTGGPRIDTYFAGRGSWGITPSMRPSWDQIAVLYAVEGAGTRFTQSEPGANVIIPLSVVIPPFPGALPVAYNWWFSSSEGQHTYITLTDPTSTNALAAYIESLMTQPPVMWIAGRVTEPLTGEGLPNVTIQMSNGGGTVTTDGAGRYSNSVVRSWSGMVTASKANYAFSPTSISVSNICDYQYARDFSGHAVTVGVSGRISRQDNGQGLDGVSVAFSAGGGTVSTAGGGYFSNSVTYGWSGTVSPSLSGWQFAPSAWTFAAPLTASPAALAFAASVVTVRYVQTDNDALSVLEGSHNWLGVRLSQNPSGTVVVAVQKVSGDADITVGSGGSLTFNSSNWSTYQLARIDAAEDADKLNGIATVRCSASGWTSKDVTVTEDDNDGGWVRVYIEPAQARAAGGQWRIEQGSWHNSGESAYDAPWVHDFTIQFRDVSGWFTPPSQQGLLNAFTPSLVTTSTYVQAASGLGCLTLQILPTNAVSAGAKWRVDGGAWVSTGESVNGLSAGSHSVEFLVVDGYVKPANQTVNINGGNTTANIGLYSPTGTCVYVSPGQSIQSAINNSVAGQTIILNNGTHSITSMINLAKSITLRSLNGQTNCLISKSGTASGCMSVGHVQAVVDGVAVTGGSGGNGAGLICSQGTILNSRFYGNTGGSGGGVSCSGGAALYNCVIDNNQASSGGAGIQLAGSARVFSSVIKNNTATSSSEGGGVYANGGVLYNCLVTGNAAHTGAGGAVGSATVDCCVVMNNTADDAGGGLELNGGAVVSSSKIQNNTALNGGGLYGYSSPQNRIANCTISGNKATSASGLGGAGGFFNGSSTVISNCTVFANMSSYRGGGFAAFDVLNICNSLIYSNTAQTDGGGIYCDANVFLTNCLIYKNQSTGNGGGACLDSGSGSRIMNCTIVNNQATSKGGGIYYNDAGMKIQSSILMNSTATGGNPNYFSWAASDITFSYSCASPQPGGTTNMNQDPKFVSIAANNFRLQATSPCIDKGSSVGAPLVDLDGVPRPLDGDGTGGAQVDIGAYEYVPPSGSVIVRIDPVYALDAGAKWTLDSNTWYSSDARVDYLGTGSKTITFTNVSGWAKPGPCTVNIVAGTVVATNGVYLPLSWDTDGDELPDDWEIVHFGRLTNACFSSDSDGDHLTDYYEHLAGTDPRDPTSCIIFDHAEVPTGMGMLLRWYSGSGMSYRVCRSTNLVQVFSAIDTNVPATPPMNFYTAPIPSDHGAFFYRIELNP